MPHRCQRVPELAATWGERVGGRRVSIALRDAGGPVAQLNAEAPHYAASTIKLAVLGAALGLDGAVRVHPDFDSAVGGRFVIAQADDQDDATWAALGCEVPVDLLVERMIQDSSNIATNLIVERIGLPAVAGFLSSVGLSEALRMGRLIGDAAAEAAGITNTVTASGLAALLAHFAGWGSAGSQAAIEILAGQKHRNLIPAGLPAGTWTASKSGWVPGVRHDVALVRPDGADEFVLAVCTSGVLPDAEAVALVRDLSRITGEHGR